MRRQTQNRGGERAASRDAAFADKSIASRTSPKHLRDCTVTIFLNRTSSIDAGFSLGIDGALSGECNRTTTFNCAEGLGRLADAARETDIALIGFYLHREELVRDIVTELRRANPDIYVAISSSTPDEVESGLADMVIPRAELFLSSSDRTLSDHLKRMLSESPIGQTTAEAEKAKTPWHHRIPGARRIAQWKKNSRLLDGADEGNLDRVRIALENGADLNAKDFGGATALILASAKGHIEVVRFLLEEGADTTIQDKKGWTARMWAGSNDHYNVDDLLQRYDAPM